MSYQQKISLGFSASPESTHTSPQYSLLPPFPAMAEWDGYTSYFRDFPRISWSFLLLPTLSYLSCPPNHSLVTDINPFGVCWDSFPLQRQLDGQQVKQDLFVVQAGARSFLQHVETVLTVLHCLTFINLGGTWGIFMTQKGKLRLSEQVICSRSHTS